MKRLFIAVNLLEGIREKLTKWQNLHKNFDVRWTKKDSLHITLFFIGWTEEKETEIIKARLADVSKNHKSFGAYLTGIGVGPDEKRPRMIWANGPMTDKLKNLQRDVAGAVKDFADRAENRPYKLHLTLARALGRIKPFREEVDFKFRVKSIELMESKLLKDGAEYRVIESFILE